MYFVRTIISCFPLRRLAIAPPIYNIPDVVELEGFVASFLGRHARSTAHYGQARPIRESLLPNLNPPPSPSPSRLAPSPSVSQAPSRLPAVLLLPCLSQACRNGLRQVGQALSDWCAAGDLEERTTHVVRRILLFLPSS